MQNANNGLFIIGNLRAAPYLAQSRSGTPVCTFTVVVDRSRTHNLTDELQSADFIPVFVKRPEEAERLHEYLIKGSQVSIVGSLRSRLVELANGTRINTLSVEAHDVKFLSGIRSPNKTT